MTISKDGPDLLHVREQQPNLTGVTGAEQKGTPLYQSQRAKCANPACPTVFHWTGGGRFFRFRPDHGLAVEGGAPDAGRAGHGVKHYWLCERCSQMFTLVYDDQCGVVLKGLCGISATEFERRDHDDVPPAWREC